MKETSENTVIINHNNKNNKIINLIFRNQLSDDITLEINKSKIKTISDIIDLLFTEIKQQKSAKHIRLFFRGRPLKTEEKIKNLRK